MEVSDFIAAYLSMTVIFQVAMELWLQRLKKNLNKLIRERELFVVDERGTLFIASREAHFVSNRLSAPKILPNSFLSQVAVDRGNSLVLFSPAVSRFLSKAKKKKLSIGTIMFSNELLQERALKIFSKCGVEVVVD